MPGLKSDPEEIPPEERVLKKMREKLNVYSVEKTRIIAIEFSSEDAKLAAAIPNAIADAYIAGQGAAKMRIELRRHRLSGARNRRSVEAGQGCRGQGRQPTARSPIF